MKVTCVQILDKYPSRAGITIGHTYHVLSIISETDKPVNYQLMSDNGITPAYYAVDMFQVVSGIIPSNWIIVGGKGVNFEFIPEAWARPGFLEDYFNGVEEAIEVFEREKELIIQEDP